MKIFRIAEPENTFISDEQMEAYKIWDEIEEKDLQMKKKFQDDIPYTDKWWKKKAIRRYKSMYEQDRIKPEQLFYWDVIGLTWEETQEKYMDEVGR